jgi:hypothetical protein
VAGARLAPASAPAREGSGRHAQVEVLRSCDGKTVQAFLDAKGNPATLANSVRLGIAKLA